jgi:hypothetical protein
VDTRGLQERAQMGPGAGFVIGDHCP